MKGDGGHRNSPAHNDQGTQGGEAEAQGGVEAAHLEGHEEGDGGQGQNGDDRQAPSGPDALQASHLVLLSSRMRKSREPTTPIMTPTEIS